MKKLMIINQSDDETRVAITDEDELTSFYTEQPKNNQVKGGVYAGLVVKVEKSLQAALVDIGDKKIGILPFDSANPKIVNSPTLSFLPAVKDRLIPFRVGQLVLVQILYAERPPKKPVLTSFVSLASRYLVFYPYTKKNEGISHKISDENEKKRLSEILTKLKVKEHGILLRTASQKASFSEIKDDFAELEIKWSRILKSFQTSKTPTLLHRGDNLISRLLSSNLVDNLSKVVVDSKESLKQVTDILSSNNLVSLVKAELYTKNQALFDFFNLEGEITALKATRFDIGFNTSLVFQFNQLVSAIKVEALDFLNYQDSEQKALEINLEAARAIAKQIMLRDIAGLIIIKFIKQTEADNQHLFNEMLKNMQKDQASSEVLPISKLGVMQISRQRLMGDFGKITKTSCPYCLGEGAIENLVSAVNVIIRDIKKLAPLADGGTIFCLVPMREFEYILNKKKSELLDIEKNFSTSVVIKPDLNQLVYESQIRVVKNHNRV